MRMQFEVEDLEVASLGSPESQKVGEKSPNFLVGILNAGLSIIIGITHVILRHNTPIIYAVVQDRVCKFFECQKEAYVKAFETNQCKSNHLEPTFHQMILNGARLIHNGSQQAVLCHALALG